MLGFYLLVTFFAQIALPSTPVVASDANPVQVSVNFEKLNGVTVGSPVIADGQLIGNVSTIVSGDSKLAGKNKRSDSSDNSYLVQLKISPAHRALLRKGTVGLINAPLCNLRNSPDAVVELIIPSTNSAPLMDGEKIRGYSSFVDFWRTASIGES